MSDAESTERGTWLDALVRWSPVITGSVAGAIALVALVGWPWQFYVVAHLAMAWLSLGLAGLALLTLARGRGRANVASGAAIVLGVAGFGFWLAAPELIGELPIFAYIASALVLVGTGMLIGRIDPERRRGVLVACGGAVVFAVGGAFTAFNG